MLFNFSSIGISNEAQIWSNAVQCDPSTLSTRSVVVENTTLEEDYKACTSRSYILMNAGFCC